MKKFIFVIIAVLFSTISYSQTGWVMKNFGKRTLTGVHFININTGFILSPDSLFKTTNGGINWIGKGTGGGAVMSKLKVFDENNIVLMGACCYPSYNYGLITRTSDGGNTWSDYYFNPELEYLFVQDMEWYDINTGITMWVDLGGANYYGRLFKTTNGGVNWNELDNPIGLGYFISIKFQSSDTLWGLTNISLYKSTNQGNNWFQASNLGTGYRTKYSCPSFDTMFIGGSKMFRSINMGVDFTATFTLDTPYIARDLEFLNAKTGFAIGSSTQYNVIKGGYIIKTTDAGLNWIRQISNTNIYISDIYFLNENTGWVVGDSGLILKTTTGGVTFINTISTEIPSVYSLSQNYPNPFNSTSNFKFEIARHGGSSTSDVKIVVYDLSGREVEVLVNERLQPGTYQTQWNASAYSSGVYFYKLETEGYTSTKKMVLIK